LISLSESEDPEEEESELPLSPDSSSTKAVLDFYPNAGLKPTRCDTLEVFPSVSYSPESCFEIFVGELSSTILILFLLVSSSTTILSLFIY